MWCRFSSEHGFEKPNDMRALNLMDESAKVQSFLLYHLGDYDCYIPFAFGCRLIPFIHLVASVSCKMCHIGILLFNREVQHGMFCFVCFSSDSVTRKVFTVSLRKL